MKLPFKMVLHSDTHTEFGNEFPLIPEDVEVVVLAGDDVVGLGGIALQAFCVANIDKQIVVVAGNHNYYKSDIETVNYQYECLEKIRPNFHFLNNSSYIYKGVVFHGTTLWTDFSALGDSRIEKAMYMAQNCIADFHKIRYNNQYITVQAMASLHREAVGWLKQSLEYSVGAVNIVVTHFPPVLACKHPHIPEGVLDAYFINNLEYLLKEFNIDYWFYGHNHYSDNFSIGNTEFLSNQRGYPREQTGWIKDLIIGA